MYHQRNFWFNYTRNLQNHVDWKGHPEVILSNLLAQAASARAGCWGPCPDVFWISGFFRWSLHNKWRIKTRSSKLDQNLTPSSSVTPSTLQHKKEREKIFSVDSFRLSNFPCLVTDLLLFMKVICFSSGRSCFLYINLCGCLNLSCVSESFGMKGAI